MEKDKGKLFGDYVDILKKYGMDSLQEIDFIRKAPAEILMDLAVIRTMFVMFEAKERKDIARWN